VAQNLFVPASQAEKIEFKPGKGERMMTAMVMAMSRFQC